MSRPAVSRSFEVGVPQEQAWQRLVAVEQWPEWAPHISEVTVTPSGELGPSSSGALDIRWFGRTNFRMSAWDPPKRWEWTGRLPGLRIVYDHQFDATDRDNTLLTWVVTLQGPLAWLVRPVFAGVYGRNLDRAIPRLQKWITRDRTADSGE